MADSKITALAALTAADPVNDMFPIVDVSDTTMAASGTTKRISVNNILGASGTATLASATITGALGAAGLNVTGATIPANGVYLGSANNLSFSAASTLGMTLNSTGLGVGVTPTVAKVQTNGAFATNGAIGNISANPLANALITDFNTTCRLIATGANTVTAGVFKFINASSNANVYLESMTLDASGKLNIGNASGDVGILYVRKDSLTAQVVQIGNEAATGKMITFHTNGNTQVGSISYAISSVAYNTSSDYRLKESVKTISGGLARVNALKPSAYKWKVDGSAGEGFLAHELAEVVPFAVTGDKDAVDADGKPTYQGVDLSKLVPILVAAIQELTARVQTLEAR